MPLPDGRCGRTTIKYVECGDEIFFNSFPDNRAVPFPGHRTCAYHGSCSHLNKNGQKTIKVPHFHPASGGGLMGIRLGAEDAKDLKGLESIYLIHEKEEKNLDAVAVPDFYTVHGEKRKAYTIPINKQSGFFKPGDCIIVVKRKDHWKKREDLYRRKVAKFCLNYFGVLTDWPNRVLRNMLEIIPLVQPYNVHAGSLFRAWFCSSTLPVMSEKKDKWII